MNRREFVKFVALMAAGASATLDALKAYEHYYEVNTPQLEPLVSVDEIMVGGYMAKPRDATLRFNFFSGTESFFPIAMNARASYRWVAAPDQKIMLRAHQLVWDVKELDYDGTKEFDARHLVMGHISYIDQEGRRHRMQLNPDKWS